MSYGVACTRPECLHFETAHDRETGKCHAVWGPANDQKRCHCPQLILPPDADEQRRFSESIRAKGFDDSWNLLKK